MTVGDFKKIIKYISDDTEIEINSILDENDGELKPSACSGFYHKQQNKVFLTPDIIAI